MEAVQPSPDTMPLPEALAGLMRPDAYPHPVDAVRLLETHISWVLLAGDYAYKIKKPVDFGFLDFSSLAKRQHYCAEEIRLNRRLAPDIYLDVAAVSGSPARLSPAEAADTPVLEWAVRMRAFPADATLDRAAVVEVAQIDAIADRLADFHAQAASAPADSEFGAPEVVMQPIRENFEQLRQLLPRFAQLRAQQARLEALRTWSEATFQRLTPHLRQRKATGFVRQCHGDLHLGNIAWVNEAPLIFDCIEFNPRLSHIDMVSEMAFLGMDLTARGREDLAWRVLDRWLMHSGDHAGLVAYRFYQVYRAMVRAKVDGLRAAQGDPAGIGEALRYLALAEDLARPRPTPLLLTHGYSGSGKSWLSLALLQTLGGIRLRSDVERKRLAGLPALAASTGRDIYTGECSRLTFAHLLRQAECLLSAGLPVLVDATFLSQASRAPFLDLAERLGLPCRILDLQATPEQLRRWLRQRRARGDDPSEADEAVLEAQLTGAEPLSPEESRLSLRVDASDPEAPRRLTTQLMPLFHPPGQA